MPRTKNLKVLFLDILTDDQKLRKIFEREEGSTYAEQMRSAFSLSEKELMAVDGSKGEFPNPNDFDAIVIGGSVEDPVKGKEKAWMKKVYQYIRSVTEKEVPILGICGGLQFTVRAFGGSIVYNPRGREFGSVEVVLNAVGSKDLLFRGMAKKNIVQSSHKCMAKSQMAEGKVLASSNMCDIQAIAVGDHIRLLQFHPEMTRQKVQALANVRKEELIKEGFVRDEKEFRKFVSSIQNTEQIGRKILKNFVTYFVLPHRAQQGKDK